ncbi:MAG: Ig-like domain-containing protein [Planctomycetes bacterium]|nr:Ig-like domain-containing protein [Planctomycetota bacterium]
MIEVRRTEPHTSRPLTRLTLAWTFLAAALLTSLTGCDNVGRAVAFTGGGAGGGGGDGVGGPPGAPFQGARPVRGNPRILAVEPSGPLPFALTSPIVVTFTESIQASSVTATTLQVRTQGTTNTINGTFAFHAGAQVVVFLPSVDLPANATLEVVATADILDLDGNGLRGLPTTGVIGSFTTVAATANPAPSIIATFPPTQPTYGASDTDEVSPGTEIVVIWSEPIDTGTVFNNDPLQAGLLIAQVDPNTPSMGLPFTVIGLPLGLADLTVTYPQAAGNRVGVFLPDTPFDPNVFVGVAVTTNIRSASGQSQQVAFAGYFQQLGFKPPESVAIVPPTTTPATPANTVNLVNVGGVDVHVELDGNYVLDGDVAILVVQENAGENGFMFTETLAAGATQVDFVADLTDAQGPALADGELAFGVYLGRRNVFSAYEAIVPVTQDTQPPTVLSLGPPTGSSLLAFQTPLQQPAIYGTASEPVKEVSITMANFLPPSTTPLTVDGNTFVLHPAVIGKLQAPESFTIQVFDGASNGSVAQSASITQRGLRTGDPLGTTLTVSVYDRRTFRPIALANVVIEPGIPVSPPMGQMISQTGADGLAQFTVAAGQSYTITAEAESFNLTTILDTDARFVSLPLDRTIASAAMFTASVTQVTGNFSGVEDIRVATNVPGDRSEMGVTDVSNPTGASAAVPSSSVAANRLLYQSAFRTFFPLGGGGTINYHDELVGVFPVADGGSRALAFQFPAAPPLGMSSTGAIAIDFNTVGMTFANALAATPLADIEAEVAGFDGAPSVGIAGASGATPPISTIGSYVTSFSSGVSVGTFYYVVQGSDVLGNISRVREDVTAATMNGMVTLPAVPAWQTAGPVTLPFQFDFADTVANGFYEVKFTDGSPVFARSWNVIVPDGAGPSVRGALPDLSGASFSSLLPGNWSVRVDAIGMTASFDYDDLLLSAVDRSHRSFARSASVVLVVN